MIIMEHKLTQENIVVCMNDTLGRDSSLNKSEVDIT